MIDHDRLFKELLTVFFLDFVELFLPDAYAYLEPDSVAFLDKELFTDVTAGEQYEADLVVKARVRGQESFFLIHLEHQAQSQANFSQRMFRYFARLYEKHELPVYPVALFSYDAPQRPEPISHRVEFPAWVVLEFNYRVIQLNQLRWRDFARHHNPVASALMVRMRMTPRERKQVKFECLRLLATLKLDRARMQLIAGFIDTYLRLNAEEEQWLRSKIMKIEPAGREAFMEIVTSWEEAGIQKGLEQGRQQGKLELVLRLLTHQVGALSPELQMLVRRLSPTQLEELGEALLDFKEARALAQWLGGLEEAQKIVLRQLTHLFGAIEAVTTEQIRSLSKAQLRELADALPNFSKAEDLTAWLCSHSIN